MGFRAPSLGRLVGRWGDALTGTRRTAAAFVNGVAQPATAAPLSFRGLVQNATGAQLQRLPEGTRVSETIAVYSQTQLFAKTASLLADLVVYQGNTYEVSDVRDWSMLAGYFEYLCVRVGP